MKNAVDGCVEEDINTAPSSNSVQKKPRPVGVLIEKKKFLRHS